jgi:UDP-N-acetyl-D-glucosamine dehydrogenase
MPFYPSAGVGGHCIPVDPIYLADKAHQIGTPLEMIEVATRINERISKNWVSEAERVIGKLRDKKIIILGVSYKPNISDTRETPAKNLISGLRAQGAIVNWNDDLVKIWNGEISHEINDEYDLAILVTRHDYLNLTKLLNVPVINTVGRRL